MFPKHHLTTKKGNEFVVLLNDIMHGVTHDLIHVGAITTENVYGKALQIIKVKLWDKNSNQMSMMT